MAQPKWWVYIPVDSFVTSFALIIRAFTQLRRFFLPSTTKTETPMTNERTTYHI